MEDRRERRTTDTLGARAITLCSCSTSSVTAMLRAGNVHSAHRWRDVLDPILSRYGAKECGGTFVPMPHSLSRTSMNTWRRGRPLRYKTPRQRGAATGDRPSAQEACRPPKRPVILYDDFWYRAGSWDRARRVVAHRGELFPRVGFIVTNMTAGPEGVVRFYNGRGTAGDQGGQVRATRLSCHRFVANRVRLSLFVLAYNLGNFLRRLCLPKAVKHWSLRSVQVKLIKMGGRLVRSSCPRCRFLDGCSRECWIVCYRRRQAEGGYNHDFAKRESAPGSRLVFNAVSPHWRGAEDDKDGQEAWFTARIASLIGRPEIDWPCRTYFDATISFGLPFEPEDSQYGKSVKNEGQADLSDIAKAILVMDPTQVDTTSTSQDACQVVCSPTIGVWLREMAARIP